MPYNKSMRLPRKNLPLMVPKLPSSKDLDSYLNQIDKNHLYTNFGPLNHRLENELNLWFLKYTNEQYYINSCCNATAGLQISIQLLGLKPKSLILIPAFTFIATALSVLNAGHIPVISDVDENTFLLTPDIAEQALLAEKFDAILLVSTFGISCDLSLWEKWKEKHKIPVIVDAAAAFGSQMPSKSIPVIYSLHATKGLPAGEGGIFVTQDKVLSTQFKKLTNFGLGISTTKKYQSHEILPIGINAKLSEYHAAIALASLDHFENWSSIRRKKLHIYLNRLNKLGKEQYSFQKDCTLVYAPTTFNVLCKDKHLRNIVEDLCLKNQVETRLWYQPLIHHHPDLPKLRYLSKTNNAENIAARIIGLPFYMDLKKNEINQIVEVLIKALEFNPNV